MAISGRRSAAGVVLLGALVSSCATTQGRFSHLDLDAALDARPADAEVEIFLDAAPTREFTRVARLDVHLERTHFLGFDLEDALPELRRQARLAGVDAIIDIELRRSNVLETRVLHVSAIGIRYAGGE